MRVDRNSVVPLYYQIQQRLLERINSGDFKSGDPLPSEMELSDNLSISRMTARQALKSLCQLGVAYSLRGKGTFVSRNKLAKDSRQLFSFSEEMNARGAKVQSKVLLFRIVSPDTEIAEALHLEPGSSVVQLRRIRCADSVPFCIETTHLPERLVPDILKTYDPATSLYHTLDESFSIHIVSANEVAEASVASGAESRLLRIKPKAPVFRFVRTAFLDTGEPAEFVRSVYRGDRCKVVSRLVRPV